MGDANENWLAPAQRAAEQARQAWPAIEIAAETYAAWLQERCADVSELAALHTADLYLACGCALGLPAALAAFERELAPRLVRATARVRLPDDARDELLQELRVDLFVGRTDRRPRVHDYRGRGPFASWLASIAIHAALKVARAQGKTVPLDSAVAGDVAGDPWLGDLKEAHAHVIVEAIRAAIGRLSPGDKLLLGQYYADRLTIDQLAAMYGIHRATAARRLAAIRLGLLDAARAALRTTLDLPDDALDSAVRLVRSRLGASVLRAIE